jgi:hypothetical protein
MREQPRDGSQDKEQTELKETGGAFFPDGRYIEVVKSQSGQLWLLNSGVLVLKVATEDQVFVPPVLNPAILRILTLPPVPCDYGSTMRLFKRIHSLFVHHNIPDDGAGRLTHFALASWFADLLPVAPSLIITGSRTMANIALQLLAVFVRHGLPIAGISPAVFRRLPMQVQPTLLISDLERSMRKLFCQSSSHSYLPDSGWIDRYCSKAAYAGPDFRDALEGEVVLHVHLSPAHGKLPIIPSHTQRELAADFQPLMLDYRVKNFTKVRDSAFDAPTFEPNLRVLAQALGACIVDEANLQAGIIPLLEDQRELLAANRWIDPRCVVLETLVSLCHSGQASSRLGVGEIAKAATTILIERGETAKLEPKPMGICLRALGLTPKRGSQGYALVLSDDLRRTIHRLARDYQVAVVTQADKSCSHCAEITAPGEESRRATI